jgi:hypothetical protein
MVFGPSRILVLGRYCFASLRVFAEQRDTKDLLNINTISLDRNNTPDEPMASNATYES